MKHLRFESIDSTNTYLKTHWQDYPSFTIVSAVRQTAGRGRMGHLWFDDGTQALFSILIKEHGLNERIEWLPFLAASVLHELLAQTMPSLQIKWPNDLFAASRKLAGILTETIVENGTVQAAILGIGINVNTTTFPLELKGIATSIFQKTRQQTDPQQWIERFASQFESAWRKATRTDTIAYCERFSLLKGKPVSTFQNGHLLHGTAGSIQPDGTLEVFTEQGSFYVRSGEVSWQHYKDAK
jgi:BirA family transcriptional regulator, biotin operon repressor / biotin---[acetyl-CoA-carboxylase] ligase